MGPISVRDSQFGLVSDGLNDEQPVQADPADLLLDFEVIGQVRRLVSQVSLLVAWPAHVLCQLLLQSGQSS